MAGPVVVVLCLLTACVSSTMAATSWRVTGDSVNLRAAADERAEVVGQVSKGDVLKAGRRVEGDWVEVVPPPGVSLWVYGELVQNDVVAVARLNVRSGPGVTYRHVGRLDKGTKLGVLEIRGEWLRIEPIAGCYLWISRQYVESAAVASKPVPVTEPASARLTPTQGAPVRSTKPPLPRLPPKKPPRPVSATGSSAGATMRSPDRATAAPPPQSPGADGLPASLADKDLVPAVEQGRSLETVGVLESSVMVWRLSRYRLVKYDAKGHVLSAAYVMGSDEELGRLVDHTLALSCREYWLQGIRDPVLVPIRFMVQD